MTYMKHCHRAFKLWCHLIYIQLDTVTNINVCTCPLIYSFPSSVHWDDLEALTLPNGNGHTQCPDLWSDSKHHSSNEGDQGSLESGHFQGWGRENIRLEYLVVPESKEVLKKEWGHIEKTWEPDWMNEVLWPSLEQWAAE